MKIFTKMTVAFLSVSLLSTGIAGGVCFFYFKDALARQILGQLDSVATAQKNRVEALIGSEFEKMSLVSGRPLLLHALESFARNHDRESQDAMNMNLAGVKSSVTDFKELYALDVDGKAAASTNPQAIGQDYSSMDFFTRGRTGNFIDAFPLSEGEPAKIYFFGPLFDGENLLGVLLIETDLSGIASSLMDYTGLGETGETVLAKRDRNGDALFLMPLRFDKEAALTRVVPKEDKAVAITQALLKKETLFTEFIDYRGKPVLSATRYLERTDWGLVVKMDRGEAYAPIVVMRNFLFLLVLAISLLAVIVSLYISRGFSSPIIRLSEAAKKIGLGEPLPEIEVKSGDEIGQLAAAFNRMAGDLKRSLETLKRTQFVVDHTSDAFFIVGDDARFLSVNDAACEVHGYSHDELLSMSVHDISLDFPPARWAENWEEIKARRSFSFETRGRTKDGKIISVEVMQNYIEDQGKEYLYVFVRDITERKRAEALLASEAERLDKTNAELERFNNLAVGREIKMIELKREINDLLKELGREKKYTIHRPE
jgi:PAS domain S-box-containing protein